MVRKCDRGKGYGRTIMEKTEAFAVRYCMNLKSQTFYTYDREYFLVHQFKHVLVPQKNHFKDTFFCIHNICLVGIFFDYTLLSVCL